MNSSFFGSTFLTIFISIIFITLCFSSVITTLSQTSNEIILSGNTIIFPENIYFSSSKFLWPTPR